MDISEKQEMLAVGAEQPLKGKAILHCFNLNREVSHLDVSKLQALDALGKDELIPPIPPMRRIRSVGSGTIPKSLVASSKAFWRSPPALAGVVPPILP
jgi:hypothetical protein